MKNIIFRFGILFLSIGISFGCSNESNRNEEKATYVQDGDTINPLEGVGEGTTGNKYMESADNSDSTQQIDQDLDLN